MLSTLNFQYYITSSAHPIAALGIKFARMFITSQRIKFRAPEYNT